jgi:hypothetical protein
MCSVLDIPLGLPESGEAKKSPALPWKSSTMPQRPASDKALEAGTAETNTGLSGPALALLVLSGHELYTTDTVEPSSQHLINAS